MTILQANIKKQLNEKNMTAAELERRTGIPHAVINILHGRSKNPSIRTAQAIAKELGCSVEDLINESQNVQQNIPTGNWQPEIYKQAFTAVYACILEQNIQPEITQLSACINEVYLYTLGGQVTTVDNRFVQWLVNKTFGVL